MLAIGSALAAGERFGWWRNQAATIELVNTICSVVLPGTSFTGKPATPSDGWKSPENWKKLAKEMSIGDVQGILGDPEHMNGGTIAYWRYPNGGTATFFIGKLDNWTEPQTPVVSNRRD